MPKNTQFQPKLSPPPGAPQTSHKAIAATVVTFLSIFVSIWVKDTGTFTGDEIVEGVISAAGASGLTGLVVYFVRNRLL